MDNKKRYKIEKIKYLNYTDNENTDNEKYDCHFCDNENYETNFTVSETNNMHYICEQCVNNICYMNLQTGNDKKKCCFCKKIEKEIITYKKNIICKFCKNEICSLS